jgi:hypothetical protein
LLWIVANFVIGLERQILDQRDNREYIRINSEYIRIGYCIRALPMRFLASVLVPVLPSAIRQNQLANYAQGDLVRAIGALAQDQKRCQTMADIGTLT